VICGNKWWWQEPFRGACARATTTSPTASASTSKGFLFYGEDMTEYCKLSARTTGLVWDKTGGKCWYCGTKTQPFDRERFMDPSIEGRRGGRVVIPPNTFVVDHIIPLSMGGESSLENLAPCCWLCNGSKKSKSLEEFRFLRSRQLAGMPRFNDDQISYLCAHGINLPAIEPYVFYYEKIGARP